MDFFKSKNKTDLPGKEPVEESSLFGNLLKKPLELSNTLQDSLGSRMSDIYSDLSSKSSDLIDTSFDKYTISKLTLSNSTRNTFNSITDKIEDVYEDFTLKGLFYNSLDGLAIVELTRHFGKDFETKNLKERAIKEILLYALKIFEKHKNAVLKEIEFEKNEKKNNRIYQRNERMKIINDETQRELQNLRTNKYYKDIPQFLVDNSSEISNKKSLATVLSFFNR